MSDLDGNALDDDDFDDDDEFDDDEIAQEGNRIVGARTHAVVEHCARALVDDPDAVDVEMRERRDEVTLLIHAGAGDMGRLIGKRGRVIQAVRQVARAAAASEGVKATVDVAE
ncbi:MAG TPA: KH domain-containing protein [Acidimicrobiia bacterium]|nr:KH domain-containing protein [Acidimicrobiia bacterium]